MVKYSKKKKMVLCVLVIFVILICYIIGSRYIFLKKQEQKSNLLYSQEYVVGKSNIKGNVRAQYFYKKDEAFEIGANSYGYAVFKKPNHAFQELKKKYFDGLKLIQKEYNLQPLSKNNYDLYGTYGDQVSLDSGTKEAQKQAFFIAEFMDIYENSYVKQ